MVSDDSRSLLGDKEPQQLCSRSNELAVRQACWQTNTHTDRHPHRQTHTHTDRLAYRQTNTHTDRQTNIQADKPADRYQRAVPDVAGVKAVSFIGGALRQLSYRNDEVLCFGGTLQVWLVHS